MVAHRSDDTLFRQSQEFIFKFAAQSSRPFNKIIYFFQQILVDFYMTALGNTEIGNLLTNQFTASVLINHNKIIVQSFFVSISIGNFYCAGGADNCGSNSIFYFVGSSIKGSLSSVEQGFVFLSRIYSGRTQEAMTAAEFAGFYAGNFDRNNLVAKKSYQPANRANKFEFVVSPAHVFGEIKAVQNIQQQFRQQSLNFCASQMLNSINIFVADN